MKKVFQALGASQRVLQRPQLEGEANRETWRREALFVGGRTE